MKKVLIIALAALLLVGATIGGTYAWLMDKTTPITNTFTVGNVDITLAETTGTSYKMVPGNTITKDPTLTVEEGSESAWVFVKIDKKNFDDYMTFAIADGWTKLEGDATKDASAVYYREYTASNEDVEYSVLKDDAVKVIDTVTKAQMDAISGANSEEKAPTLTFTGYAIQMDGFTKEATDAANAVAAWAAIVSAQAQQ